MVKTHLGVYKIWGGGGQWQWSYSWGGGGAMVLHLGGGGERGAMVWGQWSGGPMVHIKIYPTWHVLPPPPPPIT